jgi:hypothetical protein
MQNSLPELRYGGVHSAVQQSQIIRYPAEGAFGKRGIGEKLDVSNSNPHGGVGSAIRPLESHPTH